MGKKAKTAPASSQESYAVQSGSYQPRDPASLPSQQKVLNVFRDALRDEHGQPNEETIQRVKGHLFDRDFASAFGREDHLLAYAYRWSPSRSLGYLQILQDVTPLVIDAQRLTGTDSTTTTGITGELPQVQGQQNAVGTSTSAARPLHQALQTVLRIDPPPDYTPREGLPTYENPPAYGTNHFPTDQPQTTPGLTVTCLGGGAGAELVACAAWLRLQHDSLNSATGGDVEPNSLHVNCVDVADWAVVIDKLELALKSVPEISNFASAAAKAANVPMLSRDAMRVSSFRQDLLDANLDHLRVLYKDSDLITIMFTLNELYSTSVAKTQRLLFELTVATRPGTLLLVVDSPGSYSTVTLNGAEKKYPMHWLLDHTLLEMSKNTRILARADHWEKVLTDESRWFRLPKGLQYPIELENMRYQVHLYKRLAVPDDATAERTFSKPRR